MFLFLICLLDVEKIEIVLLGNFYIYKMLTKARQLVFVANITEVTCILTIPLPTTISLQKTYMT